MHTPSLRDYAVKPAVPAPRSAPKACPEPEVRLFCRHSTGRDEAERFIADRYQRDYGASLTHFLPLLVVLATGNDAFAAAAGVAPAAGGRLFLERYLDAPVEAAIRRKLGRPVERTAVLEVGNLAAGTPGGGRMMITSLVRLLHGSSLEWITFTATRALRNSLSRLGVTAHELAIADRSVLGADAASWGRYYDHDPRVVACSLQAAWTLMYGAGGTA